MGYGRTPPRGTLPVFSVGDDEEARELIVLACPTNLAGEYIAPELAREQTLPNLYAFGDRLARLHDEVLVPSGACRCRREPKSEEAGKDS